MGRVLVVHPPVTIARDWIDYPYLADLGAVQLAGELREAGHEVSLIDAYALSGATLYWRRDGRGHLGASVDEVLRAVEATSPELVVVAITPFHRPPRRDDVLGALLRGFRSIHPDAPRILADCYQSGQHYIETDNAPRRLPGGGCVGEVRGRARRPRARSRVARGRGAAARGDPG